MAHRDDGLHRMAPIRRLQSRLPLAVQDEADNPPVQQLLAPVPPAPVQDNISAQHAKNADGERDPPSRKLLLRHHAGRDDRHFLRDRHSQGRDEEDGEYPQVGEVLDDPLDQLNGHVPDPRRAGHRQPSARVST